MLFPAVFFTPVLKIVRRMVNLKRKSTVMAVCIFLLAKTAIVIRHNTLISINIVNRQTCKCAFRIDCTAVVGHNLGVWIYNLDIVEDALQTYCKRWSKKEGVGVHALNDWKNEFLRIIDIRIDNFTKHPHLFKQPSSRSVKSLKKKMEKLHRKYVFAPADKAANNVIII